MKKKLIDLTIEELEKICDTHNCLGCPCIVYSGLEEVCWKGLVENRIKEEEVEVLDNGKD